MNFLTTFCKRFHFDLKAHLYNFLDNNLRLFPAHQTILRITYSFLRSGIVAPLKTEVSPKYSNLRIVCYTGNKQKCPTQHFYRVGLLLLVYFTYYSLSRVYNSHVKRQCMFTIRYCNSCSTWAFTFYNASLTEATLLSATLYVASFVTSFSVVLPSTVVTSVILTLTSLPGSSFNLSLVDCLVLLLVLQQQVL